MTAMLSPHPHSDKTVTIKAIETRAYGCRFRSRLEARWAVFFDNLGLRWEYEPEGFDIDGEAYLPDFRVWTPQGKPIWYEVKPAHITADQKLENFARALDPEFGAVRVGLLSGSPRDYLQHHDICPRCGILLSADSVYECGAEIGFSCFECDMETPSGGGHLPECDGVQGIAYRPHKGWVMTSRSEFESLGDQVRYAAEAAMSARFEHGETP
jgi:hypothetical protein